VKIYVFRRDSLADSKLKWRQYVIVRDRSVVVIDMRPALLAGWNVHWIARQGAADWMDWDADRIRADKMANDYGEVRLQPVEGEEAQTAISLDAKYAGKEGLLCRD
jgi:hypothetical protein